LSGILTTPVGYRLVSNLDIVRAEWTNIEVFVELVLPEVVVLTVCIESGHEEALGYVLTFSLVYIGRLEEVNERVRNLRDLHLDEFKVLWNHIPDVRIGVPVPILDIASYTLE